MIRQQFLRWVLVGLFMNGCLFAVYMLLTPTFMGHQAAMTTVYCSGVAIGFVLNRKYSFQHTDRTLGPSVRYVIAYLIGYIVNLGALYFLVDRSGAQHNIVQGGVMLCLPLMLFFLQKYWVFRHTIEPFQSPSARTAP